MTDQTINGVKKRRPKLQGFRVLERQCIWMKAGVIGFRECDNDYDCNSCAFDKAMRRTMEQPASRGGDYDRPGWVARLQKTYDGASLPCRHVLTGRIQGPKLCTGNYECHHCAFDQMLDDADLINALEAPACRFAAGYKMADGYYYHMGHGWARLEHGGRVRLGFDDFMASLLGPLDAIELPPLGACLQQSQVGMTIRRGDNRAAVLSPVAGTVLAVNHNACDHPSIAHADPYHQGWLIILEPSHPRRCVRQLYFGKESRQWMEQENNRLLELLGPECADLAATGARPVPDIHGALPELGWDNLVRTFLHTETKNGRVPGR